jgi:hypothetical protein
VTEIRCEKRKILQRQIVAAVEPQPAPTRDGLGIVVLLCLAGAATVIAYASLAVTL